MKSYTDINQSKKLAEILPLESADMRFCFSHTLGGRITGHYPMIGREPSMGTIPCWSLAALLELLDYPQLSKDKLGSGRIGWMVSVYPDNCRYDSCWHDNPIDACVKMIIKLNELKIAQKEE